MNKPVWIHQERSRPALDHVCIYKSKEAALAAALVSVAYCEEAAGTPQETASSNFHEWEWSPRCGHSMTHTVRIMQVLVRAGGASDGEEEA